MANRKSPAAGFAASIALVILGCVAGSAAVSEGAGRHSVLAPAGAGALSEYAMMVSIEQPDPGEGGEEDTSDTVPEKEFDTKPGTGVPTTTTTPWGGTQPDSATHRQAPPSITFPGTADTLSPASSSTPRSAGAATSTTSSRRGILGIHPIALIAGLIALHIFVVTVAGK